MDTDLLTGRAAPAAALATENDPALAPSSYYRVPEGWYGREAAAWVEGVMAYRAGLTVRFTFPEMDDLVDQAIATLVRRGFTTAPWSTNEDEHDSTFDISGGRD